MKSRWKIVRDGRQMAVTGVIMGILSLACAIVLGPSVTSDLGPYYRGFFVFMSGLMFGMGWGVYAVSQSRQIACDIAGVDLWYPTEPIE